MFILRFVPVYGHSGLQRYDFFVVNNQVCKVKVSFLNFN